MIVFDDMTRPTPVKDVVPYVLDRLHRAGLEASQIRFIWALGGHGAYDMINARKKLGEKIVENYRRGEITDLYTGPSCLTHEVDIKEAIEHLMALKVLVAFCQRMFFSNLPENKEIFSFRP